MQQDQKRRDDAGRMDTGNQSAGSGQQSQPGMGNTDAGMGGMQRGMEEGLESQVNQNRNQQGGLGADRNTEMEDGNDLLGGDAGRGSTSGRMGESGM